MRLGVESKESGMQSANQGAFLQYRFCGTRMTTIMTSRAVMSCHDRVSLKRRSAPCLRSAKRAICLASAIHMAFHMHRTTTHSYTDVSFCMFGSDPPQDVVHKEHLAVHAHTQARDRAFLFNLTNHVLAKKTVLFNMKLFHEVASGPHHLLTLASNPGLCLLQGKTSAE